MCSLYVCCFCVLISGPPSSKKQHVEHDEESKDMEEGTEEGKDEHEWFSSDDCTICSVVTHHAGIRTRPKKLVLTHTITVLWVLLWFLLYSSQLYRHLSYISYFSPLLDSLSSPSRDELSHFIQASSPYCVPWNKLALHCMHRQVSNIAPSLTSPSLMHEQK
mgnify:CR=1 FL=1